MTSELKPTEEQLEAIYVCKDPVYKIVKIEACAGAGKTSTLVLIAEALEESSLYWAFNKVTAEEAQERFPRHVTCSTTHSTAFASFGRKLMHKLKRPVGRYVNVAGTGAEIAKFYKIQGIEDIITAAGIGLLVKQTVAKFEQSADEEIDYKHLAPMEGKEKKARLLPRIVLTAARNLWRDRINVESPVLATHDTYLKMFQLSKPNLGFPVIYGDEFQDTNACVMDIVLRQVKEQGTKLIAVGDARQAIYQWRGSVNAMKIIDGKVCYLSQSWRYGKDVADLAMVILNNAMQIKGNPALDTKVGYENTVIDKTKPYTHIFRTNAALLVHAIQAIEEGKEVKIEIDTADFIKLLESAVSLKAGHMKYVKHDKVIPYTSWAGIVEDSEEDPELKRIVKMVDSGAVYKALDALKSYVPSNAPMITFTTAHKSKGREFDQVILAEDFPSNYNKDGNWIGLTEEEQNLLYVAVTRAKKTLAKNRTVEEIEHHYISENYYGLSDEAEHEYAVLTGVDAGKQQAIFNSIGADILGKHHTGAIMDEVFTGRDEF